MLENPNVKPSTNLHFTDKYKLPNHPTFSNESKYFNKSNRDKGGHWQETDSSWNYIPFNPNVKDTIMEKKSSRAKGMAPIKRGKSYAGTSESILPFGIRPNAPDENERLSDYSSNNQLIEGLKPLPNRASNELLKLENAALYRYASKPQKAYPGADPTAPLTQGTLRGATPSREMLADLIASADKYGVSRNTMLAIAANESMFGKGYKGGTRREKNSRGALQQNVVSGWDVDEEFKPVSLAQFAHNRKIPGVELEKTKAGYKYTITDRNAFVQNLDNAIAKNPALLEEYRRANANVRSQGDINYFDQTARLYNKWGIARFNANDPTYTKRINDVTGMIGTDPVIQQVYRDYDNKIMGNRNAALSVKRPPDITGRQRAFRPSTKGSL